MFNESFYPTPRELGRKLLAPYQSILWNRYNYILEPHAGKADLSDLMIEEAGRTWGGNQLGASRLHGCEINPELRAILETKDITLVGNDFLQFVPSVDYKLFAMNPPFANADEHILYAWEIGNNCEIGAIINHETYNNPYTKRRKILKGLIAQYGSYEYVGQAFKHAERGTDAEVGIVRLTKPDLKFGFDPFEGLGAEKPVDLEDEQFNPLAHFDLVQSYVDSYDASRAAYKDLVAAFKKMVFYSNDFISPSKLAELIKDSLGASSPHDYKKDPTFHFTRGLNMYSKTLQENAWRVMFAKTKVGDLVTSDVQKEMMKYKQRSQGLPFTYDNIQQVFRTLMENGDKVRQACIVQVFDLFRMYHARNMEWPEGWKTNKKFQVQERIVLPSMLSWSHMGYMETNYRNRETMRDIDKALCFLAQESYSNLHPEETLNGAIDAQLKAKHIHMNSAADNAIRQTRFFYWKGYRKGTLHLKFKDEYIRQQLNIQATKFKNWLGE